MAAPKFFDRTLVQTTTTGSGTYSLGAAPTGYQDFAAAGANSGDTVGYLVLDSLTSPSNWEVVEGEWTAGSPATLSRDRIIASSNSGLAVSWGLGTKYVLSTMSATHTKQPTAQLFLSGSGTYTTPAGCTRIEVEMVGAGGGGSSGNGTGAGTAGGNTTFGTALLVANGGAAGGATTTPGSGGTASGGDDNITGGQGCGGGQSVSGTAGGVGGIGGSSFFGGAGGSTIAGAGLNAAANSGSGGGGSGSTSGASIGCGNGGAAGGYCRKRITAPLATYSYAVGAAGGGGAGGGGAGTAGTGAAGRIIVKEYY